MQKPLARVLVVEDDPNIGSLMRAVLSRSLLDATLVKNGEDARQLLEEHDYDLVLLDISLPGISGLEVCAEIRACDRLKHLPVIFVSGLTDSQYKNEAERLGAVDFIEKPFTLLPFLACILGHLKLKHSDSEVLKHLSSGKAT